ncbi:MAG: M28 family peptidase [Calditrichaceae bacterium]|nr:M28 family metallopeptidase [Calditrichia bacterium]NUQ43591.1 M28 family peptidase [Calditrichaceae bacterium]
MRISSRGSFESLRFCGAFQTPFKILFILVALLPLFAPAQREPFNADSAYAAVEHLCVAIGPRPMGSQNERRALQWAVDEFDRFGADTAYVMPMLQAQDDINTRSGVAVGIFRGERDSTIVVGAHIDSDRRDNPGASDNASGTGCIMELARIWAQSPRRYTLLFAAFGGEEAGSEGSAYFVEHYPDIEKVALMLNIDMAGSEGWLIPFIDADARQAPRWLVEDSYAIDRALGYNDLEYPTHFFSLNGLFPGGAAGSDHTPFMDKNIPAIDFTAGINIDPIHTPRDRLQFLSKPMLARSGRLVDELIAKYQAQGIPAEKEGHYMLWEVLGGRFYVPNWLIITLDILALALGVAALLQLRKHRWQIEKSARARFPGLKIIVLMIVIAVFTQLGEAGMQLLKGLRYPWFTHLNEYLRFAALWALAGVWVAGQLTRFWRFSPDPYPYARQAVILLILFIIVFGIASPRVALYPALTLLLFALAINLSNPFLKILLALLAPLPMLRLMFMETLPLFARTFTEGGFMVSGFIRSFLYSAAITLVMVMWLLPGLFIFAYTFAATPRMRALGAFFRKPAVGLLILLMVVGYGGYVYSLPAYSAKWRAGILAEAKYDLRSGESKFTVQGNEFLRDVSVTADTLSRSYNAAILKDELPLQFQADWFSVEGVETVQKGECDTVALDWTFISARPWYRATITLALDSLQIDSLSSELNHRKSRGKVVFRWSAEPPDTLHLAAALIVPPGRKLIRSVEAVYPETPFPVSVAAAYADAVSRTVVTRRDTLSLAPEAASGNGE